MVFSAADGPTLAQKKGEFRHGVFTYALAKGLDGSAELEEGKISIRALGNFVAKEDFALAAH